MASDKSLTPLMRQYFEIKHKYPDTLLLFQVGDFYELFFTDAQQAAAFLGIALTQRGTDSAGNPIPLCGVPVHVLDHYITKLIKGGFKVAICDQLEAPKPGKIVDRDVTQVLTPGTLTDSKLLDDKTASYLCVLFPTQSAWGLIQVELLTGHLFMTCIDPLEQILEAELARFLPDEIVIPATKLGKQLETFIKKLGYVSTVQAYEPHAHNTIDQVQAWFERQFPEQSMLYQQQAEATQSALLVLWSYLARTQEKALSTITQLSVYNSEDFLILDAATQRNLELVKNTQDGSSAHTLFSVLDEAVTPMGSRTIKKWVLRPLLKQEAIEQRFDVVGYLAQHVRLLEESRILLRNIGDLERIVGRIALKRAQLHDYTALLQALKKIPEIARLYTENAPALIQVIQSRLKSFENLVALLEQAVNIDHSRDWLVQAGFNAELDRLRQLLEQGAQAIIMLERKEQAATGINSLKIKFNGAHGYGIEITKPHIHLVPPHYMRIQTLVNRERFTTQELKDLEYDLTRARTDISEIEKELFEQIKKQVEVFIPSLKKLAAALAHLDAYNAFAQVAQLYNYTRPVFNHERNIIIENGRHPVVEKKINTQFIPNNTYLDNKHELWIITGPNMGGKSTYLRQVALITILAQIGSFIPAQKANLSIVDRIFTRIGAADNVAEGKSTFLVEMEETALICNRATARSLVILDEVGRGTSTFDGLAIAQAVVEYIYNTVKARCLFATHYHELTLLSEQYAHIGAYYAASTKTPDGIVLLHKILPGVADGSFGLEIAKQAQLPRALLDRAAIILKKLTAQEAHVANQRSLLDNHDIRIHDKYQQALQRIHELENCFEYEKIINRNSHEMADRIKKLDYENLTPKQALDFIWQLKEL
jgi:DNA mismatch repair protein MutS